MPRRRYDHNSGKFAAAIGAITDINAVVTDPPAVDAGLVVLRAGGDFADGTIAAHARRLGGAVFTRFGHGALARHR